MSNKFIMKAQEVKPVGRRLIEKGLSHINHVRQLFSCTKKASTLAKGRRQV